MDNEKKTTTRNKKEKFIEPELVVEDISQSTDEIIEKKELCKARYSDGFIYISFKGYGLSVPNKENHNEPEIYVYYTGEIGKPGFKFRI